MKNPLIKRLPRELKSEFGKYVVIFIFLVGMIAIVSGFLVASDSMSKAYDESFEKYNVEDGNFELLYKADEDLLDTIEKENVTIYENFYIEEETEEFDSTLRIFKNREEINRACLMSGEFPKSKTEIAVDRIYADNNSIDVGDTITVGEKRLTVTGLVALSDYSALFSSSSDMMFDAMKFGVAVMTEKGFEDFGDGRIHYSYSWKYAIAPSDNAEAKEMSEDLMEILSENFAVTNYIPQYLNQAICFTGDDIGKDKAMFTVFLYIVIAIIAFIFAITTSNTIVKESAVIGTLRASGYTKGELVRHYLTLPLTVTLIAATVGNILGYTWVKDAAADMYYASYSLPTFVTLWNANAFVMTTVIPVMIMFLINFIILVHKLNLSPLKFLRRDLKKNRKKNALKLSERIGIMKRFRLRIIFQNLPNYITIFVGIFLANVILLLGLGMYSMLDKYQEDITSNMICDYQYVLKASAETEAKKAEKYCFYSLSTIEGKLKSEAVSVYGVIPNSEYIKLDLDDESVYISSAFSQKYGIEKGETVTLKEEYGEKKYNFSVKGIYDYPSSLAVFMSNRHFTKEFDLEKDYFNGYFSDKEIKDIDDACIATVITVDDMTKMSRQLTLSLGSMMDMFLVFGIIMFMLIIYLLSKIIIEKNSQSISMARILGYTRREINRLYVTATSVVVIASLLLTMPMASAVMEACFAVMFSMFPGWMPYYVPFSVFLQMAALGISAYAVVAIVQMRRIKKIPLDMALKNVE